MGTASGRHLGDEQALTLGGGLTKQAVADLHVGRMARLRIVGVGRQAFQAWLRVRLHLIDDALVRGDERHELGQEHLADRLQVALALEHAAEPREVRFQPVLLGVAVGRQPQVVDHRVDVVLELGHLAAGVDLNRSGQVALRDGGGDVRDRANLRRQVGGEQVHVSGEVLPGAGGAGHVRLAAEPALDADLARDRRDLVGKRRQRFRHVVDGGRQRRDFALGVDGELLFEVAIGDRGDDLHDAADLFRQVRGHDVHVVGEVLPRAGHARHARLSAEPALGADFPGDACDFRRERVELVHHRVDGVLQLQNLALDVDGDLAREVALRDRRRDLRDVSHLGGQVRGEQVDVVGRGPSTCPRHQARWPDRQAGRRCRLHARRA